LHKDGNDWRDINYDRDILSHIPWHELTYEVEHLLDDKDAPLTTETSIDVQEQGDPFGKHSELELIIKTQAQEVWIEKRLDIAFLSRPLMDVIPNPWQASRVLLETIKTLNDKGHNDEAIYNRRLYLLERMKQNIRCQVHKYSEKVFKNKLKKGDIIFRLITQGNEHLNFEIAHELKVMVRHNERKLFKESHKPIENSLFEVIFEKDLNNLEKNFALYLADSDAVTWWHRMVARQDYALQGWQRNKIYPDFIACLNENRLLVMETKGLQLKGNDDTVYKTRLFDLLTNYYHPIRPLTWVPWT
jgi:type III restriction enzyme